MKIVLSYSAKICMIGRMKHKHHRVRRTRPAASVHAAAASASPPARATMRGTAPTAPAARRERKDGWTREKMARFIEYLAETGSVTDAAALVGMSRQSAYMLRSRLIGQPFDFAWEGAFEFGLQQLAHNLLDRCLNGVAVPVFYKGEIVGERRVFNERASLNMLQHMGKIGRNHFERDMTTRRWPEMIARLCDGPIVWTEEEQHGDNPDHPMNLDPEDLADRADREEAYDIDEIEELTAAAEKAGEAEDDVFEHHVRERRQQAENLKDMVRDFISKDSHYAKPPEPPPHPSGRRVGWQR